MGSQSLNTSVNCKLFASSHIKVPLDADSTIKTSTPLKRSWFDNVTANSLERRRDKKHLKEDHNRLRLNGSCQTLPKGIKMSSMMYSSNQGRDSPTFSCVSTNTISDFRSPSHCDNINLALNNSLPLADGTFVKSPIETSSSSGVSSAAFSHDERCFSFDDRLLVQKKSMDRSRKTFSSPEVSSLHSSDATRASRKSLKASAIETMRFCDETDQEMTSELKRTIRELKDIADVARVIDDVDDEDWLLAFIEELEVHLGDLMRVDTKRSPPSYRNEKQMKEMLLRVAQDLIDYLKNRSSYSRHRDVPLTSSTSSDIVGRNDTLRHLKTLSLENPGDTSNMTKWQRRLSSLTCALDKYLRRLAEPTAQKEVFSQNEKVLYGRGDFSKHDQARLDVAKAFKECKPSRDIQSKSAALREVKSNNLHQTWQYVRSTQPERQYGTSRDSTATDDDATIKETNRLSAGASKHSKLKYERNGKNQEKKFQKDKIYQLDRNAHQHGLPQSKDTKVSTSYVNARKTFDLPNNNRYNTQPRENEQRSYFESKVSKQTISTDRSSSGNDINSGSDLSGLHHRCGSLDRKMYKKNRKARNDQLKRFSSSSDNIDALGLLKSDRYFSFCYHEQKKSAILNTKDHCSNPALDSTDRKRSRKTLELSIEINREPSTKPKLICQEEAKQSSTYQLQHQQVVAVDGNLNQLSQLKPKCRVEIDSRFDSKSKSSSSVQCNILSKEQINQADEEITRMKKSAELLRRGITEAREERDEKDRKIAILESQVQRLKKRIQETRSQEGSVEMELDRLQRMLESEERHHSDEMKELQTKLKKFESQSRNQEKRVDDMEQWIEKLKREKSETNDRCIQLVKEKRELEEKLHDTTIALMKEKRHSRMLQAENIRLELKVSKAQADKEKDKRLAEAELKQERDSTVSHLLDDVILTIAKEDMARHLEVQGENEAKEKLKNLQEKNSSLTAENEELRQQLASEQSVSAAATDCFRQEIEFLCNEVSVHQESARAQKEQYDCEINRILSSRSNNPNTPPREIEDSNDVEVTSLQSQIVYQQTLTKTLHAENSRLRQERDELLNLISEDCRRSQERETQDFECQMDDMSYTKMRAHDFYLKEALRNAQRLVERGRQFHQETTDHVIKTRRLEIDVKRTTNSQC